MAIEKDKSSNLGKAQKDWQKTEIKLQEKVEKMEGKLEESESTIKKLESARKDGEAEMAALRKSLSKVKQVGAS